MDDNDNDNDMAFRLTAWALRQRTGDATSKTVLCVLADAAALETGETCLSQRTIAGRAEVSQNTCRLTLKKLVAAGLVDVVIRTRENGSIGASIYRVKAGDRIDCDWYPTEDSPTPPPKNEGTLKFEGTPPPKNEGTLPSNLGGAIEPVLFNREKESTGGASHPPSVGDRPEVPGASTGDLPLVPEAQPSPAVGALKRRAPRKPAKGPAKDPDGSGELARAFIAGWVDGVMEEFGESYVVDGKDAGAAVRLTKLGFPVQDLLAMAKAAWAASSSGDRRCFHCKSAATISGFLSAFQRIRSELRDSGRFRIEQQTKTKTTTTAGPTDIDGRPI